MATTTTNLGLTLPDNGEKVSRQIINTNNTLIDNAFSGVGAKIYDVTLEVSNVSGAYSGTVYDDKITASMRAIDIYAVDPSIFNDKIHVTCYAGYLTITCDDVAGTTDVTISVLKSANDPTALTSTEFDILSNRIGDLDDLTTTVKTNVVNAINEVNSGLSTANDHIANLETHSATELLSSSSGTFDEKTLSQSMYNFHMLEFVVLSQYNAVVGSPMHISPSVLALHNSNANLANLRVWDGTAWTTVLVRYISATSVYLSISNTNETVKIYGIK